MNSNMRYNSAAKKKYFKSVSISSVISTNFAYRLAKVVTQVRVQDAIDGYADQRIHDHKIASERLRGRNVAIA